MSRRGAERQRRREMGKMDLQAAASVAGNRKQPERME